MPPVKLIAVVFTGIVFPTCVSLNNCVCHFSPLRSDAAVTLKNGKCRWSVCLSVCLSVVST